MGEQIKGEHTHQRHHVQHCDPAEDCDDGAVRNRYFRGKTLGTTEFRIEQDYFIERRRLINRALFGWGVVYGFGVHQRGKPPHGCNEPGPCVEQNRAWIDSVKHGALIIAPGFALDRQGRELVTTRLEKLTPLETFVLEKSSNNCNVLAPASHLQAGRYLLSVHYAERSIEPVSTHDACGCDHDEHRFQCETVAYSLQLLCGDCPCGEPDCKSFGCAPEDACSHQDSPRSHAYQCHRQRLDVTLPTPLQRWGNLLVDPRAPVPLACVSVASSQDPCEKFCFEAVQDACGPRRIVKNNNLLFDLIRGCDLTRIAEISWARFVNDPDRVPWGEFARMFPEHISHDHDEVTTRFTVQFTKPVQVATLTPAVFTMTIITTERGTGWGEPRRVPITRIETEGSGPNTTKATFVVEREWCVDEVRSAGKSRLEDRYITVEIEIFGSLILDCNGVAVDADSRGPSVERSGNGTPGGTFRTVFRVKPQPSDHRPGDHRK